MSKISEIKQLVKSDLQTTKVERPKPTEVPRKIPFNANGTIADGEHKSLASVICSASSPGSQSLRQFISVKTISNPRIQIEWE